MKIYSTSEIAKLIGIHPNTVMLYEKWGYIAPVERKKNGYRIYTEKHLDQIKLVRIALRSDLIKWYIRFEIKNIIRSAAEGKLERALELSNEYLAHMQDEKNNELKVIKYIKEILKDDVEGKNISLSRSKTAELLGISINVIINWERNGMLEVPRNKKNGYRVYSEKEIKLLRIIKILRQENYSTQCICNMVNKIKEGMFSNIEIHSEFDEKLLSSLAEAEENARELVSYIKELMSKSQNDS